MMQLSGTFLVLLLSVVLCAAEELATGHFTKDELVFGDGQRVEKRCLACKLMSDEIRQSYDHSMEKLTGHVKEWTICKQAGIAGFGMGFACDKALDMFRGFINKEAKKAANKLMTKCSKNFPCSMEPAQSVLLGTKQ